MTLIIDDELLKHATDEELDQYIEYLSAQAGLSAASEGEWGLQGRQQVAEDALANLAKEQSHELLYGGAVGGGKTDWMLWHAYTLSKRYKKFKVLYLRKTYPMLQRTVIIRSLERFDHEVCKYNTTERVWKFVNGSRVEFGYLEKPLDIYNYLSAEYDLICWDELTQFGNEDHYTYLMSRLRSSLDKTVRGYVPHVIAATNPGGVGGGWVKKRFVDPSPYGEQFTVVNENGTKGTRVFIPAKLADNRFIDAPTYRASLGHLKPAVREALEDGSWDVVEGQFFDEWNRELHVCAPFVLPAEWKRIRCVDYGFAAPWCCLWIAFDGDGAAWVYREAYATHLTPRQQCAKIAQLTPGDEPVAYTVVDPSMYSRTGAGEPIAMQYQRAGIPPTRALNDRKAGWARVRDYLHPIDTPDGPVVGLHIFTSCVNLIRTLPMQIMDIKNPEDLDTDGEDHAPDTLRYGLMSRPLRPRVKKAEAKTGEELIAQRLSLSAKRRTLDRKRGAEHPVLGRM